MSNLQTVIDPLEDVLPGDSENEKPGFNQLNEGMIDKCLTQSSNAIENALQNYSTLIRTWKTLKDANSEWNKKFENIETKYIEK